MNHESDGKKRIEAVPLFSVFIPTSGRADLVPMAIRSVLDQTVQDFEIVIADASNSPAIRSYLDVLADPHIRYIHAPTDRGPLEPFNVAARNVRGEYILGLDDDNYLLPFALELFSRAIEKTHADIITANHLYYYDAKHPRHFLRNTIGVVPFTGMTQAFDPARAIESLFSFGRRGPGMPIPRFHFSATIVARRVFDQALGRLGYFVFPDLPNAHSLQPILFAFSRSCFFVDHPMVLIGRLGVSMSQVWSTAARKRFAKKPFVPVFSFLSAYTRINAVLENYLRVKRVLPDLLGDVPIDYDRFLELHMRELAFLDGDIGTTVKNWKDVFAFVQTRPPEIQKRFRAEAQKLMLFSFFVLIARRLRLQSLWRALRGMIIRRRESRIPAGEQMRVGREFSIPFDGSRIRSLEDAGRALRSILQKEIDKDINVLPI